MRKQTATNMIWQFSLLIHEPHTLPSRHVVLESRLLVSDRNSLENDVLVSIESTSSLSESSDSKCRVIVRRDGLGLVSGLDDSDWKTL